MKLIQLLYFCTACRTGNITRAANELHVSQPSVSMAIRELEEEFGLLLLQRNNKGFEITREGMYFYEKAQALLEQSEELTQMMCDMGNQRKRINLGIPPMIGTFLFPKMYKSFKDAFPEVMLNSREGGSEYLLGLLDESVLDFAILPINEISREAYNILAMTDTETVFCVCAGHPLAGNRSVSIEEIYGEPLVMFNEGFYQNVVIKKRFAQAGHKPNIIHYSSQFYTIKEFISSGIAAGFMFRDIAETVPEIQGISLEQPLQIQIGLVWKKRQHMFHDATRFLEFTKRYAKDLREKRRNAE